MLFFYAPQVQKPAYQYLSGVWNRTQTTLVCLHVGWSLLSSGLPGNRKPNWRTASIRLAWQETQLENCLRQTGFRVFSSLPTVGNTPLGRWFWVAWESWLNMSQESKPVSSCLPSVEACDGACKPKNLQPKWPWGFAFGLGFIKETESKLPHPPSMSTQGRN